MKQNLPIVDLAFNKSAADTVIEKYDPKATKGFENFPKEWYSYFRLFNK
jgi:hypothetical protein